MNGAAPDFWLAIALFTNTPRRCWRVKRLTNSRRRDGLLVVRVEPPVPGEPYGLPNDIFYYLLLACHKEADSLFPISTFPDDMPLPVIVCRPLVDWRNRTHLDELQVLSWALLYPSEAEARAHMTYAQAKKYGKQK